MEYRVREIKQVEQYLFITLGIFIMACGYYFFVIPSGLVTGGSTGIGIIFHGIFEDVRISVFTFIANMIFLVASYFLLGKKMFLRSIYGSIMFPFALFIFETLFPNFGYQNKDLILLALYGGVFIGMGFGTLVRYGGTSGGTDIPIRIVKKYARLPLHISLYVVEFTIIILGAALSTDIMNALYALICVFVSGKVADVFVLFGNNKKVVNIVTSYPDEIKKELYAKLGRGVTLVKSQGGYSGAEKTLVITVIANQEYHKLHNVISTVDPTAFVYASSATEIQGKWFTKNKLSNE